MSLRLSRSLCADSGRLEAQIDRIVEPIGKHVEPRREFLELSCRTKGRGDGA